ncbi:MAG: CopD family protein [Gallionellaceae bacterium]|nr:CopD family protein [Gallionellaceae bacterium]
MIHSLLVLFHVLATVIWVGGMFFAHQCLRPAAITTLEPPLRLALWRGVFGRFFPWVWVSVIALLLSGQVMVGQMGGMAAVPVHVHIMVGIGYVMAALYAYLYFVPFAAMKRAVMAGDWPAAGAALNRIRALVGTNLTLGLVNIAVVFVLR